MKLIRKQKQHQKGQALVEFAMSLPILLIILSGLLDFGRAYYTYIALEEAVAEAALYYAIFPECPSVTDWFGATLDGCDDPNNAIYRATNSGSGEFNPALTEWNIPAPSSVLSAPVSYTNRWSFPLPNGCTAIGCSVLVQVEYPFELLTPGIQWLNGGNPILSLNTQAAQIIVYDQP